MSSSQNLISNPTDNRAQASSPAGEPPGPSGVGTFVAGVGANTILALLAVMEDMMQISNLYGKMLVDQLQSQAQVATSLSSYTEQEAQNNATQMQWQGWMGVVGGGITGAIGLGGMISSPGVEDLDAEIQGMRSMREYMNNPDENVSQEASNLDPDQEAPAVTEKDIKALKNRSGSDFTKDSDSKMSNLKAKVGLQKAKTGITEEDIRTSDTYKADKDTIDILHSDTTRSEEFEDLKTSYDKKIENLETKRQSIATKHGTAWSTRTQTAGALTQVLGGFGTGYGSKYTEKAGEEAAAKDTANAALSTAQGITSETRQETETYLSKSSDTVQLIAAISQANKLPGS